MEEEKLVCFTKDELLKPREIIIEITNLLIERGLTDYSGGNMALKVGEKIYITQTESAEKFRWKIRPDDIIVTDLNRNILEGREERLTREAELHFSILEKFPDINCTIHGNSFYTPLLNSAGVKAVNATEVADYYNIKEIPATPEEVEMLSQEETDLVISYFKDLRSRNEALVTIFPYHGLIAAAKDHNEAFSLYDAVEINSKFILYKELLKTSLLVNNILGKVNGDLNGRDLSASMTPTATAKEPESFKNSAKILTSEDIIEFSKKSSSKEMVVNSSCTITSMAESKARELGIKISKK